MSESTVRFSRREGEGEREREREREGGRHSHTVGCGIVLVCHVKQTLDTSLQAASSPGSPSSEWGRHVINIM